MNTNGTTTTEAPTAALVRHEERAIEPASLSELRALAKDAADSHFFGAESPAQALMIMMAGRDLGFSYTQSLRAFHVIKGKPSLSADGMVAVCLASPVCEYFRPVAVTDTSATWVTKRSGAEPVEQTFTMEDAKAAGLLSQNGAMFSKYPKRMLSARAKAFLARDVYPELLMGLYDPDELREAPEPRRVSATPVRERPSSPHVTEEPSPAAQAFLRSIDAATTLADLRAVSTAVADANLSDDERRMVAGAGNAKTAELKKAAGK